MGLGQVPGWGLGIFIGLGVRAVDTKNQHDPVGTIYSPA